MFWPWGTVYVNVDAISVAVLWDLRVFLQHWLKKHFAQHLIKRKDFHKTSTACECGRVNRSWRCVIKELEASERSSLIRGMHTVFCRHLWQKYWNPELKVGRKIWEYFVYVLCYLCNLFSGQEGCAFWDMRKIKVL